MEVPEPHTAEKESTAFDQGSTKQRQSPSCSSLDDGVSTSPFPTTGDDGYDQAGYERLLAVVDHLTQYLESVKREVRAQGQVIERLSKQAS